MGLSDIEVKGLAAAEVKEFRNVIKYIDSKNYKRAVKSAEMILSKSPEHGETMCLQSYAMRMLGKSDSEEVYAIMKKGLSKSITSYISWHTYALLLEEDTRHEEALTAYIRAAKNNKTHRKVDLMKESANLMVHLRKYSALVSTRKDILAKDPQNVINWIALAVAHYLVGEYAEGIQVVEDYRKATMQKRKSAEEVCELEIFQAMLCKKQGDYQKAYDILGKVLVSDEKRMVSKMMEMQCECLEAMERWEEAQEAWKALIRLHPENHGMYDRLLGCYQGDQQKLIGFCDEMMKAQEKCQAAKWVKLRMQEGDAFRAAYEAYAMNRLRKGHPALFLEVKGLYGDAEKRAMVEEVMERFAVSLRETGTFNGEGEKEEPTGLVYVLFFLARHYDFVGAYEKALERLEEGMKLVPTFIDMIATKAKILKHQGDIAGAETYMDKARKMDLADRYLNKISVIYTMRMEKREEAEKREALFASKDMKTTLESLKSMQESRFELELAASYERCGMWEKAYEMYNTVMGHFSEYYQDQLDFHMYALRKSNIMSYLQMMECDEKHLLTHRYAQRAVGGVLRTLVRIEGASAAVEKKKALIEAEYEEKMAGMNAGQRKRMRKKRAAALAAFDTPVASTVTDPLLKIEAVVAKECIQSDLDRVYAVYAKLLLGSDVGVLVAQAESEIVKAMPGLYAQITNGEAVELAQPVRTVEEAHLAIARVCLMGNEVEISKQVAFVQQAETTSQWRASEVLAMGYLLRHHHAEAGSALLQHFRSQFYPRMVDIYTETAAIE